MGVIVGASFRRTGLAVLFRRARLQFYAGGRHRRKFKKGRLLIPDCGEKRLKKYDAPLELRIIRIRGVRHIFLIWDLSLQSTGTWCLNHFPVTSKCNNLTVWSPFDFFLTRKAHHIFWGVFPHSRELAVDLFFNFLLYSIHSSGSVVSSNLFPPLQSVCVFFMPGAAHQKGLCWGKLLLGHYINVPRT